MTSAMPVDSSSDASSDDDAPATSTAAAAGLDGPSDNDHDGDDDGSDDGDANGHVPAGTTRAAATLSLFWDMASTDPAERRTAAASLLKALDSLQRDFQAAPVDLGADDDDEENNAERMDVDADGAGVEDGGSDDTAAATRAAATAAATAAAARIEAQFHPDVVYTLRRLVRGLPSSRDGARLGFSLALTELLAMLPDLALRDLLTLLESLTPTTKGMKGQEVREIYFGRLFCYRAVLLSGMVRRPHTRVRDIEKMAQQALELSRSKAYLSEACFEVLIGVCRDLVESGKPDAATRVVELSLADGISTPEQLWLAVVIQENCPSILK
ncbi:DNA-directed DNA polymerase, partial [Cladochytrium tenue]